jgi:hypothetical protein
LQAGLADAAGSDISSDPACLYLREQDRVFAVDGDGVLDDPGRDASLAGGELAGALAPSGQTCPLGHTSTLAEVGSLPHPRLLSELLHLRQLDHKRGPLRRRQVPPLKRAEEDVLRLINRRHNLSWDLRQA